MNESMGIVNRTQNIWQKFCSIVLEIDLVIILVFTSAVQRLIYLIAINHAIKIIIRD